MGNDKIGFWLVLLIVLLGELPCVLRTMAMQAQNDGIWKVALGTVLGTLIAMVIGISLAFLLRTLPGDWPTHAERAAAVALIALGVWLLLSAGK